MLVADGDGTSVAVDTSSTEATSTAEATAASAITEAPIVTAAPDVTEAPVVADAPDATDAVTPTTEVFLPLFVTADCIGYDPYLLEIDVFDDMSALLRFGPAPLLLYYDTIEDARVGMAVAENHSQMCRIGDENTRADSFRYVHEFWRGDSDPGVTSLLPAPQDCISYDATDLSLDDLGDNVWRLSTSFQILATYDGESDALAGMTLAEAYDELCFIGRGNSRPDHSRYIHEYWK